MKDPQVEAAEVAAKANPPTHPPNVASINCSRFGPIEVTVMSGSADLTQVKVGPLSLSYSMFGKTLGVYLGNRGIQVDEPINAASGGLLVGRFRVKWIDRMRDQAKEREEAELARVLERWKVRSKGDLADKLRRVEVVEKALRIDPSYRA